MKGVALRRSFRVKLIAAFLVLAVVPMVVATWYNLTWTRGEAVRTARENLVELSRLTARLIEQLITEHQRTSATLAGEPAVVRFLSASGDERRAAAAEAYEVLRNFAANHPDYDAPGLLDAKGIVIASLEPRLVGKDRSFRDYFQASISGRPYVSDILVGRGTGRPGVFITNPVRTAEGEIAGIVIIWLRADSIRSAIEGVMAQREGFAYLVDQDGVIVMHPDRDLLYRSLGVLTPEAVRTIADTMRFGMAEGVDAPLIPESLGMDDLYAALTSTETSGASRYHSPLDDACHIVGYARAGRYPWTVVVEIPETRFLAPLNMLRRVTWVSVAVASIVAMIFGVAIARSVTRPVRRLAALAQAVEQRKPFSSSDIEDVASGHDEIALLGRALGAMISSLDQEIADRKESEQRFTDVTCHAEEWIWEVDADALYTYASPVVEKLLGYKPEEIVGKKHSYDLFHPDDIEPLKKATLELFAERKPLFRFLNRNIHRDGRIVLLSTSGTPVIDEEGRLCGYRGADIDITEQKRAEDELRKYRESLEEMIDIRTVELATANEELESFAYSVSHDLRAPLRGIDGFSQALLEDYRDKLDDQGKDYLRRVRAATVRMGRLIDDLLNLSRVTRSEMRREAVDLGQSARDIAAELQQSQPRRDVEFAISDGLTAEGDARLLNVVLENLLGNAWKFTKKTHPARIDFGVTEREGERAYFVRDNGAGFDMTYADKLFGAFQRLHNEADFPGTGIGLATVSRIVHRHGGKAWAEGEIDKGATFYFTLKTGTGRKGGGA